MSLAEWSTEVHDLSVDGSDSEVMWPNILGGQIAPGIELKLLVGNFLEVCGGSDVRVFDDNKCTCRLKQRK